MAKAPKTEFQPMLAGKIETTKGQDRYLKDRAKIKLPVLISPKIDGIRAVSRDSMFDVAVELVSRSLKLIPNAFTQKRFAVPSLLNIDGELCVGEPTDPNLMQQTTSGVMSGDGEPDVAWYVFDVIDMPSAPFEERYEELKRRVRQSRHPNVVVVPQRLCHTWEEIEEVEREFLEMGYEGIMGRSPNGVYKFGRSSLSDGILWKLKRFDDGEAIVLSVYEQQENQNEATTDNLGHTKRSSSKEGKVGKDTFGGAVVRDLVTGIEFKVGAGKGLTIEERARLWAMRDKLPGMIIKYQFFNVGVKEKPRFPGFLGIRDPRDMS